MANRQNPIETIFFLEIKCPILHLSSRVTSSEKLHITLFDMTFNIWAGYCMVVLVSSLSPGASTITSMSCGLNYGFRLGLWNVIGLQLALVLQVSAVAAGLGAILAASESAFSLIKWFGVAYLLYLGWRQWRAVPYSLPDKTSSIKKARPVDLILRGFLVNASNPKALIFILAILPQFLDSTQPLPKQYLVMTTSMCVIDFTILAGYTGLAARMLRLLRTPRHQSSLNKVFGGLLGAEAVMLATARGLGH
jgi:homoserine/homoserine lactone efflux protein